MLHHWFFYTIDFSAAILYISYHPSPKWKRNIPLTVYEVFQLFTAIQKSNREKKICCRISRYFYAFKSVSLLAIRV